MAGRSDGAGAVRDGRGANDWDGTGSFTNIDSGPGYREHIRSLRTAGERACREVEPKKVRSHAR